MVKKKQIVMSLIVVAVLFILSIIFVSIFANNIGISNNKSQITVDYNNSNELEIVNDVPVTNELGTTANVKDLDEGVIAYLEIVVENKLDSNAKYQIYLDDINEEDAINKNYIILYLTDENNEPLDGFNTNILPSFAGLEVLNNKPASRLLYEGKLVGKEKQKLKLKAWLSNNYSISKNKQNFKFKVNVRGV